jgi:hypothetical protein
VKEITGKLPEEQSAQMMWPQLQAANPPFFENLGIGLFETMFSRMLTDSLDSHCLASLMLIDFNTVSL